MSNYLEVQDDIGNTGRTHKLHLDGTSLAMVNLDNLDRALLDDIDHGKPSKTPLADMLLGLETLVRRIEEQQA
jgi:hypothetical protein